MTSESSEILYIFSPILRKSVDLVCPTGRMATLTKENDMEKQISHEVLRVQPNRKDVVIRTTWGDLEVDAWELVEMAVIKAENKGAVNEEGMKEMLNVLKAMKEKVTV